MLSSGEEKKKKVWKFKLMIKLSVSDATDIHHFTPH